jgi:hypothetical protein
MAVLQDNAGAGKQFHLFDLGDAPTPPKGTFRARIMDIRDEFGVERKNFEDPSKIEKVDLTAFLFAFRDRAGTIHRIDSRPMKISGNEKSNLYAFLKSLTGESPRMGWDYMELKGTDCQITVEHVPSKDGSRIYAQIAAVAPLLQDAPLPPAQPAQAPAAVPPRTAAVPARPTARPAPAPVAPPPPAPVDAPADLDALPF